MQCMDMLQRECRPGSYSWHKASQSKAPVLLVLARKGRRKARAP